MIFTLIAPITTFYPNAYLYISHVSKMGHQDRIHQLNIFISYLAWLQASYIKCTRGRQPFNYSPFWLFGQLIINLITLHHYSDHLQKSFEHARLRVLLWTHNISSMFDLQQYLNSPSSKSKFFPRPFFLQHVVLENVYSSINWAIYILHFQTIASINN